MSSPAQERSLLGGALSYEFSDCSIAAADLSKLAGEHIASALNNSGRNRISNYVIGHEEQAQQLVYADIDYRRDFALDGYKAQLVLAQRIETFRELGRRTKKWLAPRHAQKPTDEAVLRGDPFLAVAVGIDTLLPIASFARRKDGQCSYVQLGQEMYDDNFFVTTADDETERHGVIEALRTQVTQGGDHYRNKKEPKLIDTIQRFVDQQAEIQHAALGEAYERQLVRMSFKKMGEARKGLLTVVGEGQSATPEEFDTTTIIPSIILGDGRLANLVLARPSQSDQWLGDRLDLLSVTREGVAVPLATMSSQFMQIELADDVNLSPADKEKAIRGLLFTIIAKRRPISAINGSYEQDYRASGLEGEDRQVAEYLFNAGMLNDYEKYRSEREFGQSRDKIEITPRIKSHLDTFFVHPDPLHSPFPNSKPLKLAMGRLEQRQASGRELLALLQADIKFAEVLGEVRRCDEVLMHYAARLALAKEGLAAVFNNVQIGKTRAGAEVVAVAEINDGSYELGIKGRPVSMPDEPMKPLLHVTLSPALPFLGHEEAKDGLFNEEHVDELVDIISRIFAVHGG